jgi:DNA-binding NarL/FixJ family response regulator
VTGRHVPADVRRPMAATRSGAALWIACIAGREPAEALDTRDREDLVAELVGRGWSDAEIAVLTRMSTYTTARIRSWLGLPANRPTVEAAA